jgi:light-regulated signal transduction histidine kinase (bacteriophytochrome)
MEFIITNDNNKIISTNVKDSELIKELLKCKSTTERIFCSHKKTYRRQGLLNVNAHNFYLCSYDSSITNKIFKHYFNAFNILAIQIDLNVTTVKETESQKTRRLKHNLINHNSNILQELYKLIPQDSFKSGSNHIDVIESVLKRDTRKASYTYLKVLKNSNLMKAEFDVYEMLDDENPYLDFYEHQIHKVLILTLNPFWLDLVEQKVNITIQPFFDKTLIDYRTISVAFSHLFDNAAKYILPHSELNISFKVINEKVLIQIDMTSLKVEKEELSRIFNESVSGKWALEKDVCGDGIGMFMVKKLINFNKGTIRFISAYDNIDAINLNGFPYENNRIEIELEKSV